MGKIFKTKNTPTARQYKAVIHFVKNGGKSMAQSIRFAGYSEVVARQPHKVFETPAVLEMLDFLGYNRFYNPDDLRKKKEVIGVELTPPVNKVDFSSLKPEQLNELSRRLNELPVLTNKAPNSDLDNQTYLSRSKNTEINFSLMDHDITPSDNENYSSL